MEKIMRIKYKELLVLGVMSATVSACAVVPLEEPVVQAPVVVQAPPPPSCYEVAALQRVEVPAETKTVVGISLIENPPYEPIEQRTETQIITKQSQVFYVLTNQQTGNQTEVTNFCNPNVVVGPVGPAPGEILEN